MSHRRILLVGLAVLVLAFSGTLQAAETLESVEKELAEKSSKIKSLTANVSIVTTYVTAVGSSRSEAIGASELVKKGDKTLYRREMKVRAVNKFGDKEISREYSTVTVVDGDLMYSQREQEEKTTVVKSKVRGLQVADGHMMLDELREKEELKLLPEESIDGRAAYVIQATRRAPPEGGVKTTVYIAKDTGIVLKIVRQDQGGKNTTTVTFSEVKLNSEIDPERFVFKAPPGALVRDMTNR